MGKSKLIVFVKNVEDNGVDVLELHSKELKVDVANVLKLINQGYIHKVGTEEFTAYPPSSIIAIRRVLNANPD